MHLLRRDQQSISSEAVPRSVHQTRYNKNFQQLCSGTKSALTNVGMSLRKVCNHPFLMDGVEDMHLRDYSSEADALTEVSGKMSFLDQLLAKCRADGTKVLVFSQFTTMLDIIHDLLQLRGYGFERLDGAVKLSDP